MKDVSFISHRVAVYEFNLESICPLFVSALLLSLSTPSALDD